MMLANDRYLYCGELYRVDIECFVLCEW